MVEGVNKPPEKIWLKPNDRYTNKWAEMIHTDEFDEDGETFEYQLVEKREPVAVRYSFDGNGWLYADAGNGSGWFERAMTYPDAEALYE